MNKLRFLAAAALCVTATGCLTPHTVVTRHYTLAAVPATTVVTNGIHVGVGVVKMPGYLTGESLAIRKDASEIVYMEGALWAERLDNGFARVLAADLSAKIPTDQVRLGAWRPDDVAVEVYVTVEQFDVDQAGTGTLVAWWRITAPGGAKVLKSGEARLTKAGKAPATDSQNIVTTLSDLTATLSQTLAEAVREVAPR